MNDLKPCPFCGNTKLNQFTSNGDERVGYNITCKIQCLQCGCSKSGGSKSDKNGWCIEGSAEVKERLIEAWNKRA